jgi:CheY-like chemotaxis protein
MNKRPKILLVDDDPDFVESTKTVLESWPYEVVVAYQGEVAVKMAKEEKPDLILLDIIMPVKDGFSAAEQLKKDPELRKIPVVMLTSYSSRRAGSGIPASKGLAMETEDYVEKPIAPDELLKVVAQYIKI